MAKLRGRGMASINYPIGMNLGGDPSQALVHSNPSGKFTVSLSSIDLGQGMKSVTRQICAETLGVPVEDVYVDTADSDTGPHCMGSFASRGTHRVGNAVMAAAREARGGDDGGGGRGARSQRHRPRDRRARQYSREGRAASVDFDQGRRHRPRSSNRARRSPAAASFSCRFRRSIRRPGRCRPRPATPTPASWPKSRSTTKPAKSRW